ncbi:MAG TPA: tRNA epoxyqueuosine(34) reductase QueG [Bacteroidota bacterium]|nr:tRNA epoxyqueuosine(34) reductase QueG [Bacteroidota bacterium]
MNQSLTDSIRTKALELGFSKVGFAAAEPLSEEADHLREWIARRFHATMAWMERGVEKRTDVRQVLRGARSVVSLALNYYTDVRHTDDDATGKISRYAWGDDYHLVMTDRLERLLAEVRAIDTGIHGKVYVDTGPVMDKVWAARAGLGWQGKHTNLITKEYGSWVFLGELLLDCELEYDEPVADACGTCTACIDACPTDAIVAPYVLDSSKCISYLTIEHRGDIAPDLGNKLEGWVYGCDICQDVCPWNRFQKATDVGAFEPREWNIAPDLKGAATITKEEFSNRFRRSPVKRTKREGFVRNAELNLSAR